MTVKFLKILINRFRVYGFRIGLIPFRIEKHSVCINYFVKLFTIARFEFLILLEPPTISLLFQSGQLQASILKKHQMGCIKKLRRCTIIRLEALVHLLVQVQQAQYVHSGIQIIKLWSLNI